MENSELAQEERGKRKAPDPRKLSLKQNDGMEIKCPGPMGIVVSHRESILLGQLVKTILNTVK